MKHKQQSEHQEITGTKTSDECHLKWKKRFHKNPIYFCVYADLEVDKEIVNVDLEIQQLLFIKEASM